MFVFLTYAPKNNYSVSKDAQIKKESPTATIKNREYI